MKTILNFAGGRALAGFGLLCLALGLAGASVLGCGGGGGGGGGSSDGGGSGGSGSIPSTMIDLGSSALAAGAYLEIADSSGHRYDPFSLRPGDSVQLRVYQYGTSGSRASLTGSDWQIVDAASSQAVLSSSGLLSAKAVTTAPFTVSAKATVGGVVTTITQDFMITTNATTLVGTVLNSDTSAPVPYVQVVMGDASGSVVAGALSGIGGKFTMRIPTGYTRVSVKKETIPSDVFYKQIRVNGRDYSADIAGCAVKIAAPTAGAVNYMPATIRLVVKDGGPPPPPPNCFE